MKKVFVLAMLSIFCVGVLIGMVDGGRGQEGRRVTFAEQIESVKPIDRIDYGEDFFFAADFNSYLGQLDDIITIWRKQMINHEPIDNASTKSANKLLNGLSQLFLDPPLSTAPHRTMNLFYRYVSAFRDAVLSFVSFVDEYNQTLRANRLVLQAFKAMVANAQRVRKNWKLISTPQVINPFAKDGLSAKMYKSPGLNSVLIDIPEGVVLSTTPRDHR